MGELQQYIGSLDTKPDVIALQETNGKVRLPGYVAYSDPSGKATAILIRNNLAATQHLTAQKGCEHTLVEIHSRSISDKQNIYVLNSYCRPSNKNPGITETLQDTMTLAKGKPVLLLGDYNAPHQMWGYKFNSKRGREIANFIDHTGTTLLNDPQTPTRLGNSTARDTSPDLSLLAGSLDVAWSNTGVNLGSDHDILQIAIRGENYRAHIGTARLTNWEQFRRTQESKEDAADVPYEDWADELKRDLQKHTQTVSTTHSTPFVDSRLLHLWEARRSLTKRWKRQRHNRKLRKKIAAINKQAADYATSLCKENWLQHCDSLQGTLSTRKTWYLLRHLIDPLTSKAETNRSMTRTLNNYQGNAERLIEDLKNKYLKTELSSHPPPYSGTPNQELDQPIQIYELRAAIAESRKSSAPGPDSITYRLLNNLSDRALETLLKHFNDSWNEGRLPIQWKSAEVRFIPKPGKSPHIDNLRPISLTSCVGKIMERIILNRLQRHLDDTGQMPETMFGFLKHLSTQDILLQLKEEVLVPATKYSPRAVLALDLKGAFDNIAHKTILKNLNATGCGSKTYAYVVDFLTNRTATLKIGDIESNPISLGSRGTPQGSVLSPLLFNIALLGLPRRLDKIPNLRHALYADDITLWTGTDSLGGLQDTLQQAVETVNQYAKECGLACSPQKSELLIVRPQGGRKHQKISK